MSTQKRKSRRAQRDVRPGYKGAFPFGKIGPTDEEKAERRKQREQERLERMDTWW